MQICWRKQPHKWATFRLKIHRQSLNRVLHPLRLSGIQNHLRGHNLHFLGRQIGPVLKKKTGNMNADAAGMTTGIGIETGITGRLIGIDAIAAIGTGEAIEIEAETVRIGKAEMIEVGTVVGTGLLTKTGIIVVVTGHRNGIVSEVQSTKKPDSKNRKKPDLKNSHRYPGNGKTKVSCNFWPRENPNLPGKMMLSPFENYATYM